MHARARAGYNEWIPSARGRHRYLVEKMPSARLARVIEDLMLRAAGTRTPTRAGVRFDETRVR